jgi:hypothetical protein
MTASHKFAFFLSRGFPVDKTDALWRKPLPRHRQSFTGESRAPEDAILTYGEYFSAARSFLEQDEFGILRRALSIWAGRPVGSKDIEAIEIYLEKHGELYHPCRIEIRIHDADVSLVLNVAVAEPGRRCLTREYGVLEKLGRRTGCPYLPEVYGLGEVNISDTLSLVMFMGEWFDEYHEFHLSDDPADGKRKICVWDPANGAFFLTPEQTRQVYRQAAAILTCYYDVETSEEIFPWHHAAGDFVLKAADDTVQLRLISARRYEPLMTVEEGDAATMLEAMMVFLLNLTVQMRLDRLDGIFDMVWAEDQTVEAILDGFFDGLSRKSEIEAFGDPFAECFRQYMLSWTEEELVELIRQVAGRYHPQSPEAQVLKAGLSRHAAVLYRAVQNR